MEARSYVLHCIRNVEIYANWSKDVRKWQAIFIKFSTKVTQITFGEGIKSQIISRVKSENEHMTTAFPTKNLGLLTRPIINNLTKSIKSLNIKFPHKKTFITLIF